MPQIDVEGFAPRHYLCGLARRPAIVDATSNVVKELALTLTSGVVECRASQGRCGAMRTRSFSEYAFWCAGAGGWTSRTIEGPTCSAGFSRGCARDGRRAPTPTRAFSVSNPKKCGASWPRSAP